MSINEIQNEIIKEISGLEEWTEVYEYLIELGKNLKPPDESFKTQKNLIGGCQSKLWLTSKIQDDHVIYYADSDAVITRGIVELILRVLNNQKPEDIVNADLYFITETGLKTHLSPIRSNGLLSLITRMKEEASHYIEAD